MPSPFPGMDPYLEGHLWPDVQHSLAVAISKQLAPRLGPRYVARIAASSVVDEDPEAETGIVYPRSGRPIKNPIEVRLITVNVRRARSHEPVTAIRICAPQDKRKVGVARLRRARSRLRQAGVHWIELDLLRRGSRTQAGIPDCEWVVTLTRGGKARTGVWPLGLRDTLPVVPVPLLPPDPDVRLDLGAALRAIYDEAAYDLSLDYGEAPPPPPLSRKDAAWMRRLLGGRRRR